MTHRARPREAPRVAAWLAVACLALLVPGCFGLGGSGGGRTAWAFETTQLDQAAAAGRTGQGVTVAVLDTGIDVRHTALRHLVDGQQANGELVAFRDFINGTTGVAQAFDDDGHGSHVAGIIAAEGSSLGDKIQYNGVNLLGGAPHVRLVVARVCGPDPSKPSDTTCLGSAIAPAIDWAVQQGARVVSLSLGGEPGISLLPGLDQNQVRQRIQAALDQGVVVVAAAGNSGEDRNAQRDVLFPGDIKGVISVGAVDEARHVAAFSNRGDDAGHPCLVGPLNDLRGGRCDPDRKPELVAPGVEILSSWKDEAYVIASGTSQATPFVTATVALLLQDHAQLHSAADVEALKAVLAATAQPVTGQATPHDVAAGYGIVQAKAAIDQYR